MSWLAAWLNFTNKKWREMSIHVTENSQQFLFFILKIPQQAWKPSGLTPRSLLSTEGRLTAAPTGCVWGGDRRIVWSGSSSGPSSPCWCRGRPLPCPLPPAPLSPPGWTSYWRGCRCGSGRRYSPAPLRSFGWREESSSCPGSRPWWRGDSSRRWELWTPRSWVITNYKKFIGIFFSYTFII